MAFLADSDDDAVDSVTRRRRQPQFPRTQADGSFVNPLAVAPAASAGPSSGGSLGRISSGRHAVKTDDELEMAIEMSLQVAAGAAASTTKGAHCRLSSLPEELLLLITSHLSGADLFAFRLINRRFASFWAAYALERFRPFLLPGPGTWARRSKDSGYRSVASSVRSATKTQAQQVLGFARITRVVATAARWFQGLQVPREIRFGTATITMGAASSPELQRRRDQDPDAGPEEVPPLPEQDLQRPPTAPEDDERNEHITLGDSTARATNDDGDQTPLAISGERAALEYDDVISRPQHQSSETRAVSIATSIAVNANGIVAPERRREPPGKRAADAKKREARKRAKALQQWLSETRRYWLCRRNIVNGLFNYTAMERHSHATPVLLPNGTVCFSRWQMLSCYIRYEDHHRPKVKNDWGENGERGYKKFRGKCEGDPATSCWARTGHIASHRDTITVIKYHAPSETVLTSSLDGTIKVWKPRAVNEAPARRHVNHGRPNASCRRPPRPDGETSSDSDAEGERRASTNAFPNPEQDECGDSHVLPFTITEDDPEAPPPEDDSTWMTCVSTFDVPHAAMTVPRCGVFSFDVLELEGFYGERCNGPLMIVGMESGHIVLVWCAPEEWVVLDVHFTGDLRAQAVKFMNHVPFAPAYLMERASPKRAQTDSTSASMNSFRGAPAEANLAPPLPGGTESADGCTTMATQPWDPCHPYSLKHLTPAAWTANPRPQHSPHVVDYDDNAAEGEDADGGAPLPKYQSDFFEERGAVQVAVITLSTMMIIDFQLLRTTELLAYDEFDMLTTDQERLLQYARTDGISNGCVVPRRRTENQTRAAVYNLNAAEAPSANRLFGMTVTDIVGFEIPAMCHSSQFDLNGPPQRQDPGNSSLRRAMSQTTRSATTTNASSAPRASISAESGAAARADSEHDDTAADAALAAVPSPANTPATRDLAMPQQPTDAASDALPPPPAGTPMPPARVPNVGPQPRVVRALPAFPPMERDESSSGDGSAHRDGSASYGDARHAETAARATFTFYTPRTAVAPWIGNVFFLAPMVALVTSEGRIVTITKKAWNAREASDSPSNRPTRVYRLDSLYPHSTAQPTCCRISPCSGIIATGSDDGAIRLHIRTACVPNVVLTDYLRLNPWRPSGTDDPAAVYGPVHEYDSLARHIVNAVGPAAINGSNFTDGMVAVRLFPTHRSSVCSIHLDSWKLTSVDALSTVHVIDLRNLRLLWVVAQRPRPFAASTVSWRDRVVALDSMSHAYVLRQVQWLNETLLVSPLGLTKHALVAHFGGKFKKAPLPDIKGDLAFTVADHTVMADADAHDWAALVRHRASALGFQSRAAAQFHRTRFVEAMRSANQQSLGAPPAAAGQFVGSNAATPSESAHASQRAERRGGGDDDDEEWDTPDSARSDRHTWAVDTNPYNVLGSQYSPSSTVSDHARPVRTVEAEPGGLVSHVLHIVGFPTTLLMVALLITIISLRIDGIITADWWWVIVPHLAMLPDYFTLNFLSYNPRAMQHSGAPFLSRVLVDLLYVLVFPCLYVCRNNGYFPTQLNSVSWIYVSSPLTIAILINLVAAFTERARDTRLRLQASDSTPAARAVVGTIDVIQSLLGVWLVVLVSIFFDTPPLDPSYELASDYSTPNLSIFLAVTPLWIAIGAMVLLIPKLPAFNRSVVSIRTFAALISCYLGVLVFFVAPLVLFCLKFNNYYAFTHAGVTAAPVPSPSGNATTTASPLRAAPAAVYLSTVEALNSVPLTLILSPILILLLVSHILALSNVVGHYNRLMRGYTRRTRGA